MRRALLLAVLASLVAAAPASAHSVMKVEGGTIHYTANDDVSLNRLSVTFQGSDIRFVDRGADGGIQPANECAPGQVDSQGNPVEVLCPRSGISAIRVDVGEAQDEVTAQIPLSILVVGGNGSDTVTTGDGDDVVNGGPANDTVRTGGGHDQLVGDVGDDQLFGEDGDDTLQGAPGADTADGGAGDDTIRVRDGEVDRAACGEGNDSVQADARDALDACESVDRPEGDDAPAPGGGGPAPPDTTAPTLRAGGSTLQRVRRSLRITVLATMDEVGEVVAAGYVQIRGRRYVLRAARSQVTVGGGGVRLRLVLEPRDARRLVRLLRRGRAAVARVSVVATDTAGNSASRRLPRIRLRR